MEWLLDRPVKVRVTTIPYGKFQGCPIAWLSGDDLVDCRREFHRVDNRVQASITNEISRRRQAATRKRASVKSRAQARRRDPLRAAA